MESDVERSAHFENFSARSIAWNRGSKRGGSMSGSVF